MNKTVAIQKEKMNFSLVEQKNNGQMRARNNPKDGDRSKIHVLMETS